MSSLLVEPHGTDWLVGGGEMGRRIRQRNWAATPLGPVDRWPQSLRSAVSILLPSRAQICLFWGPDLVTIYNDAYRPALGVKHPAALGLPAREVWSEFWEDVLRPLLEGVLRTGEAFWGSDHPFFLERHGYPEETYFDISYDPVRNESGKVGGVFCIVSETTGRVIGERRLRTLRDIGRVAMEARSVPDAFERSAGVIAQCPKDLPFAVLYDWDGAQRVARRRACAGIDENSPAVPALIVPGDDAPWPIGEALPADGAILDARSTPAPEGLPGGPWPDPARKVAVLPIAAPLQPPYGFLVAGTSPRREVDQDYRDYLRLVASGIAAAVANVSALESERRRAEALAELDHAKTAFFSNVSHEFRTPLTLLLGPLQEELASRGALPAESRQRLETAQRNALRLLKLVNTLLDFSRIEAGRARARFEPVDLAAFTAELAGNFESACRKAGLALTVRCGPVAQAAYVDRDMWEKIVFNLLSNALKFTFEGAIEVAVRDLGDRAEVAVRDTGEGIAAHEMPRLFERFHRVQGVRSRSHEGSGIGLALVRELVCMHGGKIEVQSAPGVGSCFTVTLPLGCAHVPKDRIGPPSARTSDGGSAYVEEALGWLRQGEVGEIAADIAPAGVAREPERILVVDDNADMRDHLVRLLGQRWEVATAADGEQALARLRRGGIDAVLTDVMMPRMDGFALVRAIKAQAELANVPVIMLSARAGEDARIDGLDAGADDYLVKPFSGRELLAQVRSQLTIARTRQAAARERELLLASERAARMHAQRQREDLEELFTQAPNPIVILRGRNFVIDLANPPACRVWGRSLDAVLGRPLFEALPELKGQVFERLLDGVMDSGRPYVGRETPALFDRGSGQLETVYFNFAYTPLRSPQGAIEGILVTAFDVTEEVLARREVSLLRDQAEEANRVKDQFLAMLGHELRNPLSPIVTALQLMRLRGMDATEIDIIERQSRHLTRLVDDLLDVSRITRGKIELRKRRVELVEIVTKALETTMPLIEQRTHQVRIEVPPTGLAVLVDPERMAQVLSNLLTNAAKYSEPGSLIRVMGSLAGERVRVSVADQGMGIAAEMIGRVFDLFVQQPQTLARSEGGLGLGLAIVRNLVEMHEGSVSVRSEGPGRGSEFVVELPRASAGSPEETAASPQRALKAPAQRRRILVVDDNADARAMLEEGLKLLGHTVESAGDGPSALLAARLFHPEVALIDIGLPVMDGYELARRLREQRDAGVPLQLLAVTGYGLEADRQRAFEAGFQDHFVKPIDLARLDAAIERAG